MEVVVVHESDATAELGVERTAEDLLELMLADFVCGMRLPANTIWTARPGRSGFLQAIGIREDQLGTLVAGEPSGEPNRERVLVEKRGGSDDPRRAHMFVRPPRARARG